MLVIDDRADVVLCLSSRSLFKIIADVKIQNIVPTCDAFPLIFAYNCTVLIKFKKKKKFIIIIVFNFFMLFLLLLLLLE